MASIVSITVDGKQIKAEKGKPLLQALLDAGIQVPYFCYHPRLRIIGACRMCIVYNEKTGRLITSCNTPVEEDMVISTKHPLVVQNQKYLLQAFMTRHPLDCPICDKAGECDLQNYGALFGPQKQIVPVSALEKERHQLDWESDFLEYYSNRCVVCYRCTRACDEVVSAKALYVEERGFQANIAPAVRPMDTSTCEMCGLCVYVCPVGAIISKPFKYWTRSWLLRKGLTACNLCSVGCQIQVEYGVGDWRSAEKVYRTKPTDSLDICAKAFFGYDALNQSRLKSPELFGKEESYGNMSQLISTYLRTNQGKTAIILSSYLSNESLLAIKEIAQRCGAIITSTLSANLYPFLESYGTYEPFEWKKIKEYDQFLLIGEDLTSTATVLSYYIKGKVYKIGRVERDAKLGPVEISLDDLSSLEGEGLVVVNLEGLVGDEARLWGERIRKFKEEKGWDVMLVCKEANFLGVLKTFSSEEISPIDVVVEEIERGNIADLLIFGEDVLDLYPLDRILSLKDKVEHFIVFSPFFDGLASYASIRVPMFLMGEEDGTYLSLMGEVKTKKFLPWGGSLSQFLMNLSELLPKEKVGIKKLEGMTSLENSLFKVHLYKGSWINTRSENLNKLYTKNSVEVATNV
ncbi:2Fe-2S iron-sulfur cluster-binding protein [Thermocrinis sp.]|uniref:2Fe-2S iron-sulfur cluster-binding protein n=1 Tax=Thermocrinis sp. TaxID=2024383 RepID=UPI002FDF034D